MPKPIPATMTAVEIRGIGFLDVLDLAGLDRHQIGLAARSFDGLPRFGKLNFFDTVGGKKGDSLAFDGFGYHGSAPQVSI